VAFFTPGGLVVDNDHASLLPQVNIAIFIAAKKGTNQAIVVPGNGFSFSFTMHDAAFAAGARLVASLPIQHCLLSKEKTGSACCACRSSQVL
jgi:hypothetical protein